jgi:hypothetical protein
MRTRTRHLPLLAALAAMLVVGVRAKLQVTYGFPGKLTVHGEDKHTTKFLKVGQTGFHLEDEAEEEDSPYALTLSDTEPEQPESTPPTEPRQSRRVAAIRARSGAPLPVLAAASGDESLESSSDASQARASSPTREVAPPVLDRGNSLFKLFVEWLASAPHVLQHHTEEAEPAATASSKRIDKSSSAFLHRAELWKCYERPRGTGKDPDWAPSHAAVGLLKTFERVADYLGHTTTTVAIRSGHQTNIHDVWIHAFVVHREGKTSHEKDVHTLMHGRDRQRIDLWDSPWSGWLKNGPGTNEVYPMEEGWLKKFLPKGNHALDGALLCLDSSLEHHLIRISGWTWKLDITPEQARELVQTPEAAEASAEDGASAE